MGSPCELTKDPRADEAVINSFRPSYLLIHRAPGPLPYAPINLGAIGEAHFAIAGQILPSSVASGWVTGPPRNHVVVSLVRTDGTYSCPLSILQSPQRQWRGNSAETTEITCPRLREFFDGPYGVFEKGPHRGNTSSF